MGGWHCLSFSLFFPPKRYGEVETKKKKKTGKAEQLTKMF
jgi:hypothetical protein